MFLPFRRYLHGVNEDILEDVKKFFLMTNLVLILYFVPLLIISSFVIFLIFCLF